MSKGMVKVFLTGFVSSDPEEGVTPNGHKKISFSVPIEKKGRNGKETDWYRCTMYGQQAENLSWIKKGMIVSLVGELFVSVSDDGVAFRNVNIDQFGLSLYGHWLRGDAPQQEPEEDIPF